MLNVSEKINLEISDTHFSKIKFQEKSKKKNSYQALRDNKFWYDKECKNQKKEINKLRRAYDINITENGRVVHFFGAN